MNIILKPFAWLLLMLHNIFGSYGLALIFFALIVKVILFPFSLKGKKGMIQMNMLSGKMQQLQKKYANDKNKQNEEIQKLYAKEKVNPMSGCLWSFLPLFVLIPLYAVIREPFFYLMDLTKEQLPALVAVLNQFTDVALNQQSAYFQLEAAHVLFQNFNAVVGDPSIAAFAENLIRIDFSFLGANLAAVPNWQIWASPLNWNNIALFIIPIISAGTSLIFSQVSMKTNAVNQQAAAGSNPSMKMMLWMSPLMSLWIGFSMPAGLSIYWIANNVLSMAQEFIAGKMLKKDYEAAAVARAEQERLEKEEEKNKKREIAERKAREAEEARQNKGKKKALAAEKKATDASNNDASKVGIRAYARGRAYDPNRYGADGPTPYLAPGTPMDEGAVEKSLKKQADHLEEVAAELAVDDMIVEEIMEEKALSAPADQADDEGADETGDTAEVDPWAAIDKEIQEIQDDPEKK